jgi:MFS family permease
MTSHIVTEVCSAAGPWLALMLCLQQLARWRGFTLRGGRLLLLTGGVALAVLLIPVEGVAVARWIAGVNANFSVPLIAILVVAVYERAFTRSLFSSSDWTACWIFGAICGLALYPLALGLSRFDPYEWGWHFSPLFVVVCALTVWLIWKQNQFGLLLLVAAVAFHLGVLESTNYWDYLLDPIYALVSCIVVIRRVAVLTASNKTLAGTNRYHSSPD